MQKFILMGCEHSFESCFCVSMGTNQSDGYDAYIHPEKDGFYLEFKDDELKKSAQGLSAPQKRQQNSVCLRE